MRGDGDEARNDNGADLAPEHGPRRNLAVVRHLLVLDVVVPVAGQRPAAQRLAEQEGVGVVGQQEPRDDLDERPEAQVGARRGGQEGQRHGEDEVDGDDEEDEPDGHVDGVDVGPDDAHDDGADEDDEEPPVGDLAVPGHLAVVHVHGVLVVALAVAQALVEVDVGLANRLPLVDHDVEEVDGVKGKVGADGEDVASRVEGRRVGLVLVEVEAVAGHDLLHGVGLAVVGKGRGRVDGQVARVVHVGVEDGEDDEAAEQAADVHGARGEEGLGERGVRRGGDVPVKRGDGVEQAQAHVGARQHGELEVVRGDPRHPVELRERREEVARQPVVDEHGGGGDEEEAVARDGPAVDLLARLGLGEGAVHGDDGHERRPQRLDGIHGEAAQVAGQPHAHELHEERQHELVAKVDKVEPVVDGRPLHQDHAVAVGRVDGDVEGDGGEHLLLERPRARVERVPRPEHGRAPVRQHGLEGLAAGEEQDLDDGVAEACGKGGAPW